MSWPIERTDALTLTQSMTKTERILLVPIYHCSNKILSQIKTYKHCFKKNLLTMMFVMVCGDTYFNYFYVIYKCLKYLCANIRHGLDHDFFFICDKQKSCRTKDKK